MLKSLFNGHLMVIGDMILDRYLFGVIERISREAPVLVLQQAEEKSVAGGAANVVNNIASLGGFVFAVGALGEDSAAQKLKAIFASKGNVSSEGMLYLKDRHTITKTRVIAGGRATVSQQVVRIDRDCRKKLTAPSEDALLKAIDNLLPKCNGVILSDYGSGTITPAIRRHVIEFCRQKNIPAIVDSRYDITSFSGIDYVKQNDAEIASALKMEVNTPEQLSRAGRELLARMKAKGILVTRGEKGMSLFLKDGSQHDIPVSDKSEVYDVSGAGDTCVAAFMLAIASGIDPITAARLSNSAAGIAVRKVGTATVSSQELAKVWRD